MIYPNNIIIGILPKWITNKAIIVYAAAFILVSVLYFNFTLPWYYMLSGVVAVLVFFLLGNRLSKSWNIARVRSEKAFEQRLFWLAFLFRLLWTILIYWIFMSIYGDSFGFEDSDAMYYDYTGTFLAEGIHNHDFIDAWRQAQSFADISDLGYASYLAIIYTLTDNSILAVRVMKCVWSAFTCVLVYRIAKRNFDEETARLAAIFCMLWPNFWYYCGAHLKEVEMTFLATLFVDQTDQMLRTRNFSAWKVIPLLLISGALFLVRTPLAIVTILCLLFSIFMSSKRVIGWGKRIIISVLAISLVGLSMGNRIQEEANEMISKVQSGEQKKNMQWRSKRDGDKSNKFAKYASTAVFAPLIFSIPFPTMTAFDDSQDIQKLLHGGNYIKNILSFFTILVMLMLLLSGTWREHLVPLSYMLGYLVVLAMSTFAQSERFHQPAMPMELMFAAYGLSLAIRGIPIPKLKIGGPKTFRRWFGYWCFFMFIAAIGWNWFKLAGRGLV